MSYNNPNELLTVRRARESGALGDGVFTYDKFSPQLRTQIVIILEEWLGPYKNNQISTATYNGCNNAGWNDLIKAYADEAGDRNLRNSTNGFISCCNVVEHGQSFDQVEGFVDFAFRYLSKALLDRPYAAKQPQGAKLDGPEAIAKLNYRLQTAKVGYQFEGGSLIRIDSQHLHRDVVMPVLKLLAEPGFEGANDEYIAAHHAHLEGRDRDAISSAGNAMESTMKCICMRLGWEFKPGANARELIKVLREHGLFPSYEETFDNALILSLESGVPTVRNKSASHGSGPEPLDVQPHTASYVLHLAATKMLYMVELMKQRITQAA